MAHTPQGRLYEDFCVLQGSEYECPVSFNKLTPAWFVNDAGEGEPNIRPDSDLKFRALRDIAAGEDWEGRLGCLNEAADTVLFVISPDAVASERCAWEVKLCTGGVDQIGSNCKDNTTNSRLRAEPCRRISASSRRSSRTSGASPRTCIVWRLS